MTTLSPAAQAVVAAIEKFDWESGHFSREEIWFCSREVVAAALCAAAYQVVPPDPLGPGRWDAMDEIRAQLIAIATELEAANDY
jgi:hypothetical protein